MFKDLCFLYKIASRETPIPSVALQPKQQSFLPTLEEEQAVADGQISNVAPFQRAFKDNLNTPFYLMY